MLYQLSCYSVLIPLTAGSIVWGYLDAKSKIIALICLFATVPQLTAIWYGTSNYRWLIYNFYTFCDAVLILFYFHYILKTGYSRLIYLLGVIGCAITATIFITQYPLTDFQNYWVCINSFTYILLTLSVFGQRMSIYQEKLLDYSISETWYLIAFLLYNVSTFLVMLLFKVLHQDKENPLWSIHHVFNAFFYILLAIGLTKNRKTIPAKQKI